MTHYITYNKFGFITLTIFFLHANLISAQMIADQHFQYDIVKGGKTIGSMTAIKKVSGDTIQYSLSSETLFKVIFTLKIKYIHEETYIGGVLQSGHALSTLSGKVQRESTVTRKPECYEIEMVSDRVRLAKKEIVYSIPEIYFSEPVQSTRVFSQVFGTYLSLEKIGDHKFQLFSEDGKNNYYYEDGICIKTEVFRPYANFSLVLRGE